MAHDWANIHSLTEAAALADRAATNDNLAGWGGTGQYCHQEETPFGLARLYATASRRREAAWNLCHDLRSAPVEDAADYTAWGVKRGDKVDGYRTRRGAKWSATRFGGEIVRVIDRHTQRLRIEAQTLRMRKAVAFALAAGELVDAIELSLGGVPAAQAICGQRDGILHIQGPKWWAGKSKDDGMVLVSAVQAFVAGAPVSVFA